MLSIWERELPRMVNRQTTKSCEPHKERKKEEAMGGQEMGGFRNKTGEDN